MRATFVLALLLSAAVLRADDLAARVAPPAGFERAPAEKGSFAHYLRHVPLQPAGAKVHLFDGREKPDQTLHHAVLEVDTGQRDLQQCADAVIRLRAEHLFAAGRADDVSFRFTSGHPAEFRKWAAGHRPKVSGNGVTWPKTAAADASYASFRRYLDVVFTYAGTLSLSKELHALAKDEPLGEVIEPGMVFIQGGSPGHAVIVMDVAKHPGTGKVVFLIAQSYMPAQEIHVLKNPTDGGLSPWYSAEFDGELKTPEWTFKKGDLKRF